MVPNNTYALTLGREMNLWGRWHFGETLLNLGVPKWLFAFRRKVGSLEPLCSFSRPSRGWLTPARSRKLAKTWNKGIWIHISWLGRENENPENWVPWISPNIWRDTVSKWTHRFLQEGNNLERSLSCACGGCYPRLSGGGSELIKKVPVMERFPRRFNIVEHR